MKGKRQFWLAVLALFIPIMLFGFLRQARFKQLARHDLNLMLDRHFSPSSMGTDQYKIAEARVSRRGHLYNKLYNREYRNLDRSQIQAPMWPLYLFMLTKRSDPQGTLMLANQYKAYIDNRLLPYDSAKDKKAMLANLNYDDNRYFHRLLQHRISTDRLISQIEHQIEYETPQ